MVFKYKSIEAGGAEKEGTIDAANRDLAIAALQRRGMVIVSINEEDDKPFLERNISFFGRVSQKEIVILSRQISTLFEAQVSAVKTFRLLGTESGNLILHKKLAEIADDVQSGVPISGAMGKHSDLFSSFYVNMVRAGEESGKLNETFAYLADYLDRSYELASKTKNALIYPIFVIITFITVMILMLTLVIPRLSSIITESGQEIPLYTKIVLAISQFLVDYGLFLLIFVVIGIFYLLRFQKQEGGARYFDNLKLTIPYISDLYKKLYLSRIADNMDTMLTSGISMVRAIEITGTVVDNKIYEDILKDVVGLVKSGSSMSEAFSRYPEQIPSIMIQMIKVGEETGELGYILKTLAKFYKREVETSVDTLVGLIEPVMIISLGLGVGFLLTSILVPIYNIAGGI